MSTILIVGIHTPREREIIERSMYGQWEVVEYLSVNDSGRFACLVESVSDNVSPHYQMGRLQSFGTWGVTLDPTPVDVLRAGVRAAGGVPA